MKIFNTEDLIRRTGGWYILIVILISQFFGLLGILPGAFFLRLSVELNDETRELLGKLLPILLIVSETTIIIILLRLTRASRNRLNEWRNQSQKANPTVELIAWKEITNLPTIYGVSSLIVHALFSILPPFLITLANREVVSSVFQPGSIASPVPMYILLGGLASLFGVVVLSLLLLERLTIIPRLILLPNDFENQLSGRSGALLGIKFQVFALGLIIVAVAVIAPLGYQQTVRILYSEVSSFEIFNELQTWSILLSSFTLGLGIAFSYLATRAITDPISQLIETFQKVEQGDLLQRVPVTATDELATVAIHFNRMISRLDNLQATLEEQVTHRTKQLKATNEVGRVASSILDPDELLAKITTLIAEQFDYYYAAIYLVDPSEKWAELKEATGQTGKVLKQNRHRLEISGRSMVAISIRDKMPRIAQKTSLEKQRADNPLLPYTRSEIALPLTLGDRVLGSLNVQSTKEDDFDVGVIETMQNLAGQIAIALENARLYQEAQQSIEELRAIQKQYLLEGWGNVSNLGESLEYGVGEPSETATQRLQTFINLRDQIIGEINIVSSDEWTPEQRTLVDAIAAQAAIALENARLVTETRQIAMRERSLAEINSKIWASPTIDSILQTVIKEIGKRLNVSSATIELNVEDKS